LDVEPTVLRAAKGGVEIDVIVTPHAKSTEVLGIDRWRKRLAVKVTALPEEGKANRAVGELLTAFFGAEATIVHGAIDRQKTFFLPISIEQAQRKLEDVRERP
jgi:uncharacterized protein